MTARVCEWGLGALGACGLGCALGIVGCSVDPPLAEPTARVSLPLSWLVTDMNGPRAQHATVGLANGQVLVCGGSVDYGTSVMDSCDVYDPSSGAWSGTGWPKLPTARMEETLTLLADGRVLLAGGMQADGYTIDQAQTGTSLGWSTVLESVASRSEATATRFLDGRVLLLGGQVYGSEFGVQGRANLRVADDSMTPADQRWSPAGMLSVRHHTATLLNGEQSVLVAGGEGADAVPLDSVQIYNVSNGQWQDAAPLNFARTQHTATRLDDGRVLVVGGTGFDGSVPLAQAELYDPQANRWTLAGTSAVRTRHLAGRLGPYVILAGGTNGPDVLDSVQLFDPVNGGGFRDLSPLSTPRLFAQMTPTTTADGQPALLVSGGGDNIASSTAELIAIGLLGRVCSVNSDCGSGQCTDHVCCDRACSGTCEACNIGNGGICQNVSGEPQAGHGACPRGFICDGLGACTTACSSDADCSATYFCDRGRCVTQVAAGGACTANGQCLSDLVCSAGVCCQTECAGSCQACNKDGICVLLTGAPRAGSDCSTGYAIGCAPSCDGISRDCTFPTGGSCGEASCDTNQQFAVTSGVCVANGRCQQASVPCNGYACGGDTCRASCAGDSDCANGYQCLEKNCVVRKELEMPCSTQTSGSCPAALYCLAGVCCAQAACDADSRCLAPSFTCKKMQGASCTFADQCASGFCVDGACCAESQCGPGSSCAIPNQAGSCRSKNGGACVDDAVCGSAHCLAGTCVECVGDADCAAPALCDPENHCSAPPGAMTSTAGCTFASHRAGGGRQLLECLFVALTAFGVRRCRARTRR